MAQFKTTYNSNSETVKTSLAWFKKAFFLQIFQQGNGNKNFSISFNKARRKIKKLFAKHYNDNTVNILSISLQVWCWSFWFLAYIFYNSENCLYWWCSTFCSKEPFEYLTSPVPFEQCKILAVKVSQGGKFQWHSPSTKKHV